MRAELQDKVGEALKVPTKSRRALDCLESKDVFVVFLPDAKIGRADFVDARPLLRQAVVAVCAAFETYLGDKAMSRVGPLLHSTDRLTPRLYNVPLTLGTFIAIEERYKRRGAGVRHQVVEPFVREQASTAPSKVGELLSAIGVKNWSNQIDDTRNVPRGATVQFLGELTARRNKIAHEGDRVGRGRGQIDLATLVNYLDQIDSVVKAIEAVLS